MTRFGQAHIEIMKSWRKKHPLKYILMSSCFECFFR